MQLNKKIKWVNEYRARQKKNKKTEPTRSVIANGDSHRCKCKEGMSNQAVHVAMAITMIFISTTILAREERKSKELLYKPFLQLTFTPCFCCF